MYISDCVTSDVRLCCEVMVTVCVCERDLFRNTDEAVTTTALVSKIFTRGEK